MDDVEFRSRLQKWGGASSPSPALGLQPGACTLGHFTSGTGKREERCLPSASPHAHGSEPRAVPHPQHGYNLLQLLVEEVDDALLPLDEDGAPHDLALAVGDEVVETLHLLVQLRQRLLMHVYLAASVGDVQGGLSNVTVKF